MVELTNENSLLQEINRLSDSKKIRDSVALTTRRSGSGLTAQEAKTKIQRLIPTTLQRLSAAKFYLTAMENMNFAPYLGSQFSLSEEQKPLVNFLDSDLQVQINLLNPELFPLVVFLVLQGFFSNLVSLEDCIAKIINIAYDLIPSDERPSDIGKALNNKIPHGNLTTHLRTFHAIGQDGKMNETGSSFNIAKKIRNKLVHDEIAEIVLFPSWSLLGVSSDLDLYLNNLFFPDGTVPKDADTEIITFCKKAYDETVGFVDECYRLIYTDLQHSGDLPV